MTELDAEMPQDVWEAIEGPDGVGIPATFKVVTKSRDPVAGTVTDIDSQNVVRKISPPVGYDKEFVDGVSVLATDEQALVAAKGITFTPVAGMELTYGTETRRIESVKPHRSGTLIAAYELQLR